MSDKHMLAVKLVDALLLGNATCAPVGSTYILGSGADLDVLALVHDLDVASARFEAAGWTASCPKEYATGDFRSYRSGEVNAIVTASNDFFNNFIDACEICKYLKVSDKAQRAAVHEYLRGDREELNY